MIGRGADREVASQSLYLQNDSEGSLTATLRVVSGAFDLNRAANVTLRFDLDNRGLAST